MESMGKNEKIPHTSETSIEMQANSPELATILMLERAKNPTIRAQALRLLHAQAENAVTVYGSDPKTPQQIAELYDKRLAAVEGSTPVELRSNKMPEVKRMDDGQKREVMRPDWVNPRTGEKLNARQMSISEAHEKGHVLRPYDSYKSPLFERFMEAFDPQAITISDEEYQMEIERQKKAHRGDEFKPMSREDVLMSTIRYFDVAEIVERMGQLKNYFGMRGAERFTKKHLDYAREHYVADTGMDNLMTAFFQAITPEKEDVFIALINNVGV